MFSLQSPLHTFHGIVFEIPGCSPRSQILTVGPCPCKLPRRIPTLRAECLFLSTSCLPLEPVPPSGACRMRQLQTPTPSPHSGCTTSLHTSLLHYQKHFLNPIRASLSHCGLPLKRSIALVSSQSSLHSHQQHHARLITSIFSQAPNYLHPQPRRWVKTEDSIS
jgi:hypothetical protein